MTSLLEYRLWRLLCRRKCIKRYFTSTSSCQVKKETSLTKKLMENTPRRNPLPLFLEPKVQSMLTDMSGYDVDKITAARLTENATKPSYEFMSEDDLREAKEREKQYCDDMMQMPPYMNPRKEIDVVLSKDPEIAPCLDTKYVFTDISHGIKDRERIIVVRDENGTLRQAHWNERDRMNRIYYPQAGRNVVSPVFFNETTISRLIFRDKHRYVLDKACVQFEPDDEQFIKIYRKVYDNVTNSQKFNLLWSTRFYGHMIFDRAWTNKLDKLLLYYLEKRHNGIVEASKIVNLTNYLFGKSDTLDINPADTEIDTLKAQIQNYIEKMPDMETKKQLLLVLHKKRGKKVHSSKATGKVLLI